MPKHLFPLDVFARMRMKEEEEIQRHRWTSEYLPWLSSYRVSREMLDLIYGVILWIIIYHYHLDVDVIIVSIPAPAFWIMPIIIVIIRYHERWPLLAYSREQDVLGINLHYA